MSKRVLIIFPNEWLAYTPTLLNLVTKLSDSFEIKVLAIDDGRYKSSEIYSENFEFLRVQPMVVKLNAFLEKKLGTAKLYQLTKMALLFFAAKSYKGWADEVIAIDSAGLWVAQRIFGKCHFMSLELFNDKLFQQCDLTLIESVIIQSQERYDYLFGDRTIKTFLIQNSPPYQADSSIESSVPSERAIFLGNANSRNGAYVCIEALRSIDNLSLTVKGSISNEDKLRIETSYGELLDSGRLAIDDHYIKQDDIIAYLSQYYVGFCFYDLSCTDDVTQFNFISVPSGKLFNYYAAGVPVIGSNLPGLSSVKEFETGILLDCISAEEILHALNYIDANHQRLRENCFKAAVHFDFNSAVKPFEEYLLSR